MVVMGSAHHRCEEQGDMERTGNARSGIMRRHVHFLHNNRVEI